MLNPKSESAQTQSYLVATYQKVEVPAESSDDLLCEYFLSQTETTGRYESLCRDVLQIAKNAGCERQALNFLRSNHTYDEVYGFFKGIIAMHDAMQPVDFDELIALNPVTIKQVA